MYVVPYLIVKAVAYIGWCYMALRWFQPAAPSRRGMAILLGLGRLLLGVGIGIVIFFAALSMNNATRNAPLTYVAIYVPVRIVEWTVWYFVSGGRGFGLRALAWIAGGVVISCAADIPIGIAEGGVVPVGRPFC